MEQMGDQAAGSVRSGLARRLGESPAGGLASKVGGHDVSCDHGVSLRRVGLCVPRRATDRDGPQTSGVAFMQPSLVSGR
jgi:hypothetical protein